MTTTTSMPHILQHQVHAFVCPCCGYEEETVGEGPQAFGAEVFETVNCPRCKESWRNEYRLFATRHKESEEVAIVQTQPLAALMALDAMSWLDEDPCDTPELAAAKKQAREALAGAQNPN